MSAGLSEYTMGVLLHTLGINKLDDVLDKEYQDINRANDFDRGKVHIYDGLNRGSVRLNTQRFYTVSEYEDRVERVKSLSLP